MRVTIYRVYHNLTLEGGFYRVNKFCDSTTYQYSPAVQQVSGSLSQRLRPSLSSAAHLSAN